MDKIKIKLRKNLDKRTRTALKEYGGMIKNLLVGEADFIGANLAITSKRFQILDFMQPVSVTPSGFVVKRQKMDAVAWEVFILPFHPKLWLFLIVLCGGTSLALYIMHRYPKAS